MKGIIGARGLKVLQEGLRNKERGIDSDKSDYHELAAELEVYADARYQASDPDLTRGVKPEMKDGKPNWDNARHNLFEYQQQLRDACFAAWIKNDPVIPHEKAPAEDQARCRKLAKVVSALCHLYLSNCWDSQTGRFKKDYPLFINRLDEVGEGLQEFQNMARSL